MGLKYRCTPIEELSGKRGLPVSHGSRTRADLQLQVNFLLKPCLDSIPCEVGA